jgi:ATP-dependent Lhr-like helicase
MLTPYQVKALIPRTWPLFFARHGRFTPVQEVAIPPIIAGHDTLVTAATAAGKTEAVIAPLLERWWEHAQESQLTILYICPTRALVRDLAERLQPLLANTAVKLATKTGDFAPLSSQRPPSILLTTPESADSLLTRSPKLFITTRAIVLDEIHLFDNTPRGDHVRCLLERIERIRTYALPKARPTQRVALSATVLDAAGVMARYLGETADHVSIPGGRHISAEIRPLYDLGELAGALTERAARKTLLFCNSRHEVEKTAAYLRQKLSHHAEIFVHYSTLDSQMRQEVEARFASAATAICVCTSTLELGIDIGTVDDVALLGAPADLNGFLQRIGRGGRRTEEMRVLCLPKSPREWAQFEALLAVAQGSWPLSLATAADDPPLELEETAVYGFRPSVLVQQIFSLIRQSPTGQVRLADVRRLAPPHLTTEAVRSIVSQLVWEEYLQAGRPGDWGAGPALQELLDRHEIYSNIGTEVQMTTAVDAYSGQVLGQTERSYPTGAVLLFGGRPMRVVWQDKYRFGLTPAPRTTIDDVVRFGGGEMAIPFVVAQAVARGLGIAPAEMPFLPAGEGIWLFHFWGTVWGKLLAELLLAQGVMATSADEYALYLPLAIPALPPWDEAVARRTGQRTAANLADMLGMGRFHSLLPADVASAAVVGLLNMARLGQLYRATTLTHRPELGESLTALHES